MFDGERPHNLLVLSIDTLRRLSVGRYSGRPVSPFLDSLAEQGVVLDDHITCSNWTLPGTLCTIAGRHLPDLGVIPRFVGGQSVGGLPDGAQVLPHWLRDAGLSTALLTTNGNYSRAFLGDAFESYTDLETQDGQELVDAALALLDTQRSESRPWMFNIHFMDPHNPYDAPASYLTALEGRPELAWDLTTSDGAREVTAAWDGLSSADQEEIRAQLTIRYEAQITAMDDALARLWSELSARGALDDTLVLVWSDHGEQLLGHGSIGHQGSLFAEESDGVAFWWADTLQPVAWSGPTSAIDIVPTTLDALGLPIPAEVTGTVVGLADPAASRFGIFWPGAEGSVPLAFAQIGADQLQYRFNGGTALYRRDVDPGQLSDVYTPEDPDAIALWAALEPVVAQIAALTGATAVPPR